jgi:hypothetical protein
MNEIVSKDMLRDPQVVHSEGNPMIVTFMCICDNVGNYPLYIPPVSPCVPGSQKFSKFDRLARSTPLLMNRVLKDVFRSRGTIDLIGAGEADRKTTEFDRSGDGIRQYGATEKLDQCMMYPGSNLVRKTPLEIFYHIGFVEAGDRLKELFPCVVFTQSVERQIQDMDVNL